jgi:uncharacterized NAD(P)/FAD-binding protein YdhS
MQNNSLTQRKQNIAIIGGGASGTLTGAHLLRQKRVPLRIVLIEPRREAGIGLAYCTEFDGHLLNVPAGAMSALPEDPEHFVDYAKAHYPDVTNSDFLPRKFFRQYLKDIYAEALANNNDFHEILHIEDKVSDLERESDGFAIRLSNGQNLEANTVVLALGNLAAKAPGWLDRLSFDDKYYIHDVWNVPKVDAISPTENLLIVGSGLTAIDQLIYLASRGHKGKITCVSRHGHFPQAHFQNPVIGAAQDPMPPANAVKALHELKARAKAKDWRLVVDGIRSLSQEWWQLLDTKEQKRFLRHAQSYWDIHRHRMPFSVAEIVKQLEEKQQLQLVAGKIASMAKADGVINVTIKLRGSAEQVNLQVDHVLNCTGPQSAVKTIDCPLLEKLYERKLVVSHPSGGGFKSGKDGIVISDNGTSRENLYAIGPMLKAQLFESVAVPEIKTQAKNVATAIIEKLLQRDAVSNTSS